MLKYVRVMLAVVILSLAACKPKEEAALPTVFDLAGTATQDTLKATLNAPTLPPTRSIPTLPATFTPTSEPSLTPTNPAEAPTVTPSGFHAAGTLYYIYNGDSIAALPGDGAPESLVLAGGKYSDLTLSPDGKLLTYVAAGSGSAREVFISSRDGTYTQQISCLGFANIVQPTWRPDGQAVAFLGSPVVGGAVDIYIANLAGANDCPHGNDLHPLVKLGSTRARDLAWNPAGDKFFFSDLYIFGLDVKENKLYPLTTPGGFGPDFALAHSPNANILAYLRTNKNTETGQFGGELYQIDTSSIKQPPSAQGGASYFAQDLHWSRDGKLLLIGTNSSALVVDPEFGTSVEVVSGLPTAPGPTFDPAAKNVAYIGIDPTNPMLQQIFVVSRSGGTPKQITTHKEGTISDLNWVEG